jgi:lipopolysaccharide transport system ATP-binding protein
MESVSHQEGRTVLFVSHNLQAVRQLCRTGLLMAGGRVQLIDKTPAVLEEYSRGITTGIAPRVPAPAPELLDRCYLTGAGVESLAGEPLPVFPVGQPWRIRVRFRAAAAQTNFVIAVGLVASDGTPVQTVWHPPQALPSGNYEALFEQTAVMLEAGHYTVVVGLSENDRSIQQVEATHIDVVSEGALGYLPVTSGAGAVLNSMRSTLAQL